MWILGSDIISLLLLMFIAFSALDLIRFFLSPVWHHGLVAKWSEEVFRARLMTVAEPEETGTSKGVPASSNLANSNLAIELRGLRKTYAGRPTVEAVRGIDLQVPRGICFGLLGPNGAGKTTTIEILEGLHRPTSGDVRVLGRDWASEASAIRERIGVSLQETELSDRLTVLETLQLFRSFYRSGISAEQAMSWVRLEEKAQTWIKKLSGGQKQRLAVATALVGNPELLFLDEPTTGLDPSNRRQLWDIIQGFKDQGRTILLTTHYMEEAEVLCEEVAIVDRGQIIAQGSPAELIRGLGAQHFVELTLANRLNSQESVLAQVSAVDAVVDASWRDERLVLVVEQVHRALPSLLECLKRQQWELADLSTRQATLEDVFVRLTGRTLNEEETNGDD